MFTYSQAQKAPAMFIFGDSLVDVGNNSHLKFSLNKVDFPHYGIDFPNKASTGRFSNGKNDANFLGSVIIFDKASKLLSDVNGELQQHLNSTNLQQFLPKSLFPTVIGSNDIYAYFHSSRLREKSSPKEYVWIQRLSH
ncbi:hypothetical protein SO802_014571 [Lithocarpus litseifolius]|uniref:Uncharacterized protein n=1 Tax=Lithocarpus litseifolius TaxID=425828 RepID=A0AAW2CVE9_9ROSI